ncbi:MAG TPA: thioesterase domain-containing protein [Actinocrinis sp.]|nr:thioesterase domain-containing protein [Actinocrinis sp.]
MPRATWFLKPPAADAGARLFCLPYSGCGASMFHGWPGALGPAEVVPLQLPGRENRMREKHFGTYRDLAVDLVDAIAPHLDRPYGIFGHCGGALPTFEALLRIDELGLPAPTRCFLSSQVAPQDGPYGRFLGMTGPALHAELVGLLAELGNPNPSEDMLDLYVEVLQADLAANRVYHRAEPVRVSCPLTVIGWDRDVEVPHELMGGWAAWGPVAKHVLPGNHYSFLHAPAELQDLLRQDLVGD